jgi:hypothetical protein
MNIQLRKRLSRSPNCPNSSAVLRNISHIIKPMEKRSKHLKDYETNDIFVTDKVACDPFFSPKLAGRRYALWARDLIDRGSRFYLCTYKGETVGFNMNTDKGTYFDAFSVVFCRNGKRRDWAFCRCMRTFLQFTNRAAGS